MMVWFVASPPYALPSPRSHLEAHQHRSEDLFLVALHVSLDAREQRGAHKVALLILGDLRGVGKEEGGRVGRRRREQDERVGSRGEEKEGRGKSASPFYS